MNLGHPTNWLGPLVASFVVAVTPGQAAGQAPAVPVAPPASPFGITDNSFLVEEAFNQEAGIFQNIFLFSRVRETLECPGCGTFPAVHRTRWEGSFTQEWPVRSVRHQFSYTLPFSGSLGARGLDDLVINYRLQLKSEGPGAAAISPRLSLIVPTTTGESHRNDWGLQANVPVSKRAGAVYFHVNAGATWMRNDEFVGPRSQRGDVWRMAPVFSGSAIWAVRPMTNFLVESLLEMAPNDGGGGGHDTSTTISPGLRTGWNYGDKQFVDGIGVPITRGAQHDVAVLTYVSYELPFRK